MPIIKNKLPSDLVFFEDSENELIVPGATEEHEGELEISDSTWDFLQDDEEAAPYIRDGALYLYIPEPVTNEETPEPVPTVAEEQTGGAE